MTQPYAILGIDPGMASGACVGAVRNGGPLQVLFEHDWKNPKQLACAIRAAFQWLCRLKAVDGIPPSRWYFACEGLFAKSAGLGRMPERFTGVMACERCAGAWETEAKYQGAVWCARAKWSIWAPGLVGIRKTMVSHKEVDPFLPGIIKRSVPTARDVVTKSDHHLAACGLLVHRDDLLRTGVPPNEIPGAGGGQSKRTRDARAWKARAGRKRR